MIHSNIPVTDKQNTKQCIKCAFLKLLQTQSFTKIRITSICTEAHITRSTFYFHYTDIYALLHDIIDDALILVNSISNYECQGMMKNLVELLKSDNPYILMHHAEQLPPCHRLIHIPEYHALFTDITIAPLVTDRIYEAEKPKIVPTIMKENDLSEEDASLIFRFIVSGTLAINQLMSVHNRREWYAKQANVLRFILRGLQLL